MVKQHPILTILTYTIIILCLITIFIGFSTGFINLSASFFKILTGILVVSFVALTKTLLCFLLIFSFYYYEKKHDYVLLALCSFILLLPITLHTANNFNLYNQNSWFIDNPLTILLLTLGISLFVLIKQTFFNLSKNLIEVSILDGIKTKDFFTKIYLPTAKINIVAILLIQFIYGYVKFQ